VYISLSLFPSLLQQFIKVSAADLEEFCDDIEVEGFPSFRVYKDGKLVDEYTGSKYEKVSRPRPAPACQFVPASDPEPWLMRSAQVEEFIRAKIQ